jgi:hypothetical protein
MENQTDTVEIARLYKIATIFALQCSAEQLTLLDVQVVCGMTLTLYTRAVLAQVELAEREPA